MSDYLHTPYFVSPDVREAQKILDAVLPMVASNLGCGTTFLTLLGVHPELAKGALLNRCAMWMAKKAALRYKLLYPKDGVGWNDFHMARWLILGTQEDFSAIYFRYCTSGPHQDSCVWMVDSIRVQCDRFNREWLSFKPV